MNKQIETWKEIKGRVPMVIFEGSKMQKQIEEMKKIVCNACDFICDCEYLRGDKKAYTWCDLPKEVCEALYNAGYRKVNDDEFVLSTSEVDEFRKDQAQVKFLKKQIQDEIAREILLEVQQRIYDREIEAERILRHIKFDELAETYGVEVEDE